MESPLTLQPRVYEPQTVRGRANVRQISMALGDDTLHDEPQNPFLDHEHLARPSMLLVPGDAGTFNDARLSEFYDAYYRNSMMPRAEEVDSPVLGRGRFGVAV
jgi:hypothetical protein